MQIHATCVARESRGVLLLGPSGAGKSDLALRLIGRGFVLVADDRVDLADGLASPPDVLAGLLEVRGVGLVRMAFEAPVRVVLAFELGGLIERLPVARVHEASGAKLLGLDPFEASAADKVAVALDCLAGGS